MKIKALALLSLGAVLALNIAVSGPLKNKDNTTLLIIGMALAGDPTEGDTTTGNNNTGTTSDEYDLQLDEMKHCWMCSDIPGICEVSQQDC